MSDKTLDEFLFNAVKSHVKEQAKECAKEPLEKLRATGVEITPEREEIIVSAIEKMMIASLAAHALMRRYPDKSSDELTKILDEDFQKAREEEGELRWKKIKN